MIWDSIEDATMMLRDAQDWRLLATDDPAARAAFAAWARESPANVAAFLIDTMLNVELNGLDSARQIDLDALISIALRETPSAASAREDSEV
jgi:ferric-dicitrate binding protein FerR (iron transport regulator)